MMTLEQFRATGRNVEDLGPECPGLDLEGEPGRVYANGLWIQRWDDDRHGVAPPDGKPTWLLTLYNEQFHGDLSELEERLYEWGVDEAGLGECKRHTDTGRGVCADCGVAL